MFATAVELFLRNRTIELEMFQPHHPLYNPIVTAVTALLRACGIGITALDAGAAVSALSGGIAVGVCAFIAQRSGVPARLAALGAGVLAAGGGLWGYATRMEVYALAAAAVAIWLAFASDSRARPWATGGALAAAILSHAATGLLFLPTAWRFRREPRALTAALGVGLGVPAAATLARAMLMRGATSPTSLLDLILSPESRAYLGSPRVLGALGAVRRLVDWGWYRDVPVLPAAVMRLFDVLGWIALVILAFLVARAVRYRPSTAAGLAAVAIACFVPLWLFWEPGNVEHAVAASPLFGVLAIAGAASMRPRWGEAALAAALIALLAANGLGCALPSSKPENGRVWVTAGFIETSTSPDALVMVAGTDARLRLGLGYLSGRHVADLALAVRAATLHGQPPEMGLAGWIERAADAKELWALDDVFDPETETAVARLGIDPAGWRRAREGLRSDRMVELPADGAVILHPVRLYRIR